MTLGYLVYLIGFLDFLKSPCQTFQCIINAYMLVCMINIYIVWIKQYADVTDDEENIFLPELQYSAKTPATMIECGMEQCWLFFLEIWYIVITYMINVLPQIYASAYIRIFIV